MHAHVLTSRNHMKLIAFQSRRILKQNSARPWNRQRLKGREGVERAHRKILTILLLILTRPFVILKSSLWLVVLLWI